MKISEQDLRAISTSGLFKGRALRLLWIMPFWPTRTNPTALTPAREVAHLLARAGHSVALLGMSEETPEPSLPDHGNLYEDPLVRPGSGPGRQAKGAIEIARRARRLHAEQPFDLVYVRFAHPIGVTAAIVAALLRLPLIYQEEAPDLAAVTERRIERFSMWTMKHRARLLCASGPSCAADVADMLDRPVYPIPLAVDTDKFHLPSRTLLEKEQVRLIAVGRLHPQKGTSTLIKAMSKLPSRFELDLVGDGEGRKDAEELVEQYQIADRVRFHGFQPPSAIAGFLERAHIFVLPSRVESFCVAAAEALASGLPTVVTRCGGPEYFVGEEDGRVIKPNDPTALAHAITHTVNRYREFNQYAIRERAHARFGPAATLQLYEKMFASVLLGVEPETETGPFGPFWFPPVHNTESKP